MPEARPYRRVLALIRLDGTDEKIARKALLLARLNHAELAFLHLAETEPALDGGYPSASHQQQIDALKAGALRRLGFLAGRLGAAEAVCLAQCGPARQSFGRALKEWQPDLVVSARDHAYLSGPHDVLVLGQRPSQIGGALKRLTDWLASQLFPATA